MADIKKMRVLITGAGGFIGENLANNLRRDKGFLVYSFDRSVLSDKQKLKESVKGVEAIVHLAGLVKGKKRELYQANVEMTEQLLKAICSSGQKPLFVFASSFAVYGPQSRIIKETSTLAPRNYYGKTKLDAERIIQKYVKRGNFPTAVLRFANVYGPGMPPFSHSVISTFLKQISDGELIRINGTGEQERDFVYIGDVVEAIKKILISKFEGVRIANICSGKGVSMKELIYSLEKIIKTKAVLEFTESGEDENDRWVGSCSKAKDFYQWRPKTSLISGLTKTYEGKKKN